MGIKFDIDPLAAEQNNYATKIVYDYIAYDLDAWLKISLKKIKLEIFLVWCH